MLSVTKIILIINIFIAFTIPVSANLTEFLTTDTTDQNEYLPYYTCGHFARELTHNAHKINKTMGSAILGDSPVFRGYNNHIVNYVFINGTLLFIEPQTDNIFKLKDIPYKYIKLYPDGTQVPSQWIYNMQHSKVENGTIYEPYNIHNIYENWKF
jgi:hypothetical protein